MHDTHRRGSSQFFSGPVRSEPKFLLKKSGPSQSEPKYYFKKSGPSQNEPIKNWTELVRAKNEPIKNWIEAKCRQTISIFHYLEMHKNHEIQTHLLKKSVFNYISGLLYGYFIEFSGLSLACELTSCEIFGLVQSEPIFTSQKRAKINQRARAS